MQPNLPDLFGGNLPVICEDDLLAHKTPVVTSVSNLIRCPSCGAESGFYSGRDCKKCDFCLDDTRHAMALLNSENEYFFKCFSEDGGKIGFVEIIVHIPIHNNQKSPIKSKIKFSIPFKGRIENNRISNDDNYLRDIEFDFGNVVANEDMDKQLLDFIKNSKLDKMTSVVQKDFYGEN